MEASHQCGSGARESLRSLAGYRCAMLKGSTAKVPETMAVKALKWVFLVLIYEESIILLTMMYTNFFGGTQITCTQNQSNNVQIAVE